MEMSHRTLLCELVFVISPVRSLLVSMDKTILAVEGSKTVLSLTFDVDNIIGLEITKQPPGSDAATQRIYSSQIKRAGPGYDMQKTLHGYNLTMNNTLFEFVKLFMFC